MEIARIEYPDLDPLPWIRRLDAIAAEIDAAAGPTAGPREYLEVVNRHLFGHLGFRGNERDYYDVRNSCLNDVLDRRLGIPITLSIIYIEIARRLDRPVHGIALPAHFIVEYDDGQFQAYIDPFHGGELLAREDCVTLVRDLTGSDPPDSAFKPCPPRRIVERMLQNLKAIYVRAEAWQKALRVFDLILAGGASQDDLKQRAGIFLTLRHYHLAMADLARYVKSDPPPADRADIGKQMEAIHRYLALLN